MDRKREENEESAKTLALITSPIPTTIESTTNLTPNNDDESSMESSDAFESWTLVNDKGKMKVPDNIVDDSENRIEILRNSDNDEDEDIKTDQELQMQDSWNDVPNEDLSDGISIISESESVGRLSPHPYVRDHLHELNMKFSLSDHMDDTILNRMREEMDNDTVPLLVQQPSETTGDQQLRQRCISSTASPVPVNQALQKAPETVEPARGLVLFVKRGLRGIFYLGVGLALLGLIGKIVNPTWQPLSSIVNSSPSTDVLEQKVNDMELQNNLMRAEIDLLNKQVKYLSSINYAQQQKSAKYKDYKERKTFKAWSGNGDSLKPVEITKQDLKKPYRCPDGSFVEIANMCIEKEQNKPSIEEQFAKIVGDRIRDSEAFKIFEEMTEELYGSQDNPVRDPVIDEAIAQRLNRHFLKNKPISNNKKYGQKDEDSNLPASNKYHKYGENNGQTDENYKPNKEYKKSFVKDDNKQSEEYKKIIDHGNSRNNSKERNEWKGDKFSNNNSNERKYRKDNSRERYTKNFNDSKENQSKERYNKQKRKYDKKNDRDGSGEWQEKYMKHREQQRKQNEQKYQNNKNWYIKLGDSRENKRNGEI